MELSAKFQSVAASGSILKPFCITENRAYPIVSAEQERIFHYNQITLNIRMNDDDDDEVARCVLSPSYSRVFSDRDIPEINAAEPDKFKLFYRKQNCRCGCGNCHYMSIQT
jgi:hypothetical protein